MEDKYHEVKNTVLAHIQVVFQELEEDMAMSHQEKYALLEDAFENAADTGELRVAYDQWFTDHAAELDLDHNVDELWDQAVGGMEE
jgi:DNA-binding transcriptional regulator/RsmH inhibitor MraZ